MRALCHVHVQERPEKLSALATGCLEALRQEEIKAGTEL